MLGRLANVLIKKSPIKVERKPDSEGDSPNTQRTQVTQTSRTYPRGTLRQLSAGLQSPQTNS